MEIRILVIDSSSALMPSVFALRHQVFVIEQAVAPDLERDGLDASAIHLAAMRDVAMLGTLRIVRSGPSAKIGRMAVLEGERRRGIGSQLMRTAETIAGQTGAKKIVLHAQLSAREFYRRLGYCEEGEVFDEAGIAHIAMRKTLA